MSALKDAIITLLDGGDAWTTGATARDADDKPCPPLSANAVKWDLMGALIKSNAGATNFTAYHEVLKELAAGIPASYKSRDIESWNDTVSWSDISSSLTSTPLSIKYGAIGEVMEVSM